MHFCHRKRTILALFFSTLGIAGCGGGNSSTSASGAAMSAAAVAAAAAASPEQPPSILPQGQLTALLSGPKTAQTPTMGWSSWNPLGLAISQSILEAQADALKKNYLSSGYNLIAIDDGWYHDRDQTTFAINADTRTISGFPGPRFPTTSLRPLVDYIHAKGIKAGIYTDLGRNTCAQQQDSKAQEVDNTVPAPNNQVGSLGHEVSDMTLFFDTWDFDYIKIDGCGVEGYDTPPPPPPYQFLANYTEAQAMAQYQTLDAAIAGTNKYKNGSVVINATGMWGGRNVRNWGKSIANQWRTHGDIHNTWSGIMGPYNSSVGREFYAGPGHWNDMDQLEIGVKNGDFEGVNDTQLTAATAHMSLWSILASPLILGHDLTSTTAAAKAILPILTNAEVIAVNQDVAGNQATRVSTGAAGDVLVKALNTQGKVAVVFFNPNTTQQTLSVTWSQLRFAPGSSASVRDLWQHTDIAGGSSSVAGATGPSYSVAVPPQSAQMYIFSGTHILASSSPGSRYLSEMPAWINVAQADPSWGTPVADKNIHGNPIQINGTPFNYGIASVATNLQVALNKQFSRFDAQIGIDDNVGAGRGSVRFMVYGDGKLLYDSNSATPGNGPVRQGMRPYPVSLDVSGVNTLELIQDPADGSTSYDEGIWANAKLTALSSTQEGETLTGAVAASCSSCSNGAYGSQISNKRPATSAMLLLPSSASSATLVVKYLSAETRSLRVTIGSNPAITVNAPPTETSWGQNIVGTLTIPFVISPQDSTTGAVRVKFDSPPVSGTATVTNGWAPDIDVISITP